jgi:hypothetical protein
MRLDRILALLERTSPGSRRAQELKCEAEHALMRALQAGGVRAVERLVKELDAGARRLEPKRMRAGIRAWRESLAGGARALELHVGADRSYKFAYLLYLEVPKLTPAQQKAQALQKRFYDRYMEVGQKAYRDPGYRLSPTDRRLLLVGELEADVNNGGFSQYLGNKGRRRGRAALAALEAIGARKTAKLLARALESKSDKALAALDDAFYKAPEDLAVLAARHASL